MTPYWHDDHLTVHIGDCRAVMADMEPESVHCVVTSPPYWGLRDYGTATWAGGDADCDHRPPPATGSTQNKGNNNREAAPHRHTCGKCGAVRQDNQLGLEPTPEEYVAAMVDVFREVRRVLRDDGTVWLNLGDSYARGQESNVPQTKKGGAPFSPEHAKAGSSDGAVGRGARPGSRAGGLAQKQLIGIPWRVAFALQADGWYLRSDIIWAKPNPMPESVTDRPTKAHEYVFLLTKSPRYYFDSDAVREPHTHPDAALNTGDWAGSVKAKGYADALPAAKAANRAVAMSRPKDYIGHINGRNIRTVWTIATQPYPGAHFATFPEKLVEPCVKAGTSERGVCPECGAPWVRVVERVADRTPVVARTTKGMARENGNGEYRPNSRETGGVAGNVHMETTGWRPSCVCHPIVLPEPVPATILDLFAGSGTVGRVANRLGRRAVLIDLSADYIDQAMLRNAQAPLGLGA